MTERKFKLKEVCVRLVSGRSLYSDGPMDTPRAAFEVMRKELSQLDRECLCVVNLNTRLQPINFNIVSVGELNQSIVAIPNVLKSSLLSNAAGFLLLHNHPSGDPTPSRADIEATKRVIEAGKIIGIQCLDHIVIGADEGRFCSFREENLADFGKKAISMTAEEILGVSDISSIMQGGKTMAEERRVEISIKFGKGLAEPFTAKDGKEYMRIAIPNTDPQDKNGWATFVLPAKDVHENKYGKGLWAKIPAEGKTSLTKPMLRGQDEQGKNIWEDVKIEMPNADLKSMVEAYKNKAPQNKEEKESIQEKLEEKSEEVHRKPEPEKKKAKNKAKGQER